MTTLLFYQRPVPLNPDVHLQARLGPLEGNFSFSAHTNSIPLAAVEFFDTAREYPIAFAGKGTGGFFPIALLGVRENENLFVGPNGRWDANYVPAFVRRYPFVLAEKQDANDFNVYLDEAYPGFGADKGERLFTDAGEHTPMLKQALEFLSTYQGEITRTRQFAERLQELGLLVPRVLEVVRKDQAPLVLQGFSVVDEERLVALDDAKLIELARSGFLGWIYAHLMSLGNVPRLAERLEARMAPPSESSPAAKPAPAPSGDSAPKKKR